MKEYYLRKADENLPELNHVKIIPDVAPFVLDTKDEVVIDLGNHYVGYFIAILNNMAAARRHYDIIAADLLSENTAQVCGADSFRLYSTIRVCKSDSRYILFHIEM